MPQESIRVRVSLFGSLRALAPNPDDAVLDVTLPLGSTAAQLGIAIGLPAHAEVIVGINGNQAELHSILHHADRVVLFNALSGGRAQAPAP
ncbi:MAG: hypothetical protein DK306_001433 [Chloroflexi bacterium]|jgi:molybdopterin converting factor small subunit|nr:MAG: hypothetical protein DK306_001433 [Chloroflexota bacterium]